MEWNLRSAQVSVCVADHQDTIQIRQDYYVIWGVGNLKYAYAHNGVLFLSHYKRIQT